MSSNALVSVVIPIYNVEKYIDECLESVVAQVYRNIEIILVNDASPDSSGKKCDAWAKKDKRIVVVHKPENEGLNMARATGLEVSTGEWVSFVDSDDIVSPSFLNDMLLAVHATGADIAVARNRRFEDGDKLHYQESNEGNVVIKDKAELMRHVFVESPDTDVYMITTWSKLFRRDVLTGIDWNLADARSNEDELEAMQYYNLQKNGVVIVKKTLYYYRNNPNSITNSKYSNKYQERVLSRFEWIEELYNISNKYFGGEMYADELLYHNVMLNLLFLNKEISRGMFADDDYKVFYQNFYSKMKLYDKISRKYPLRYEEKRAFDAIKDGGSVFSFWSDDRRVIDDLRQANDTLQRNNDTLQRNNERLHKKIKNLENSKSYKLGRAIASPYTKVKKMIK